MRRLLVQLSILPLMMNGFSSKAQQVDSLISTVEHWGDYLLSRNQDTTYIANYGNKVGLKMYSSNKYNFFRINDRNAGARISYKPIYDLSLGGRHYV